MLEEEVEPTLSNIVQQDVQMKSNMLEEEIG